MRLVKYHTIAWRLLSLHTLWFIEESTLIDKYLEMNDYEDLKYVLRILISLEK